MCFKTQHGFFFILLQGMIQLEDIHFPHISRRVQGTLNRLLSLLSGAINLY